MPSILNLKFKGNKSFVAFSNLNDAESLTKTWKVCTKVASYLEQGQRLENLSWRLWHLQNLMVDTDNAKSKREFKKLSKCMSDKLDKEKGRSIEELEAPDFKRNSSSEMIRQRAEERERSREASQNAKPGTIKRMQFTFSVDQPTPVSNAPVQKPDLKPSPEFNKRPRAGLRSIVVEKSDEQMVVVEDEDKDPPLTQRGRKMPLSPSSSSGSLSSSSLSVSSASSATSASTSPSTSNDSSSHSLKFPSLFSNDFGPSALLYPSPTLTTRMNYGEGLNPTSHQSDGFSIPRPTIELPLDDILNNVDSPRLWSPPPFPTSFADTRNNEEKDSLYIPMSTYHQHDVVMQTVPISTLSAASFNDTSSENDNDSSNDSDDEASDDVDLMSTATLSSVPPIAQHQPTPMAAPRPLSPPAPSTTPTPAFTTGKATGRPPKAVTSLKGNTSFSATYSGSTLGSSTRGRRNTVGGRPQLTVRTQSTRSATVTSLNRGVGSTIPTASAMNNTGPGGVKAECSNCGATHTPLWRRGLNDELNCNACGLYCKLHKRPRPKTMRNSHGEGRSQTAPRQETVDVVAQCYNCHTTATPLWRKDDEGKTVCNACGLYYKLHGSARPISMKSDVIRKRSRHDARRAANGAIMAETPSASPGVSRRASPSRESSPTLAPDSSTSTNQYDYSSANDEYEFRQQSTSELMNALGNEFSQNSLSGTSNASNASGVTGVYGGNLMETFQFPGPYHPDHLQQYVNPMDPLPFANGGGEYERDYGNNDGDMSPRTNKRRRMSVDSASEPPSSAVSYSSYNDGYSSATSATSHSQRSSIDFPFSTYPSVGAYQTSAGPVFRGTTNPFWHPPMMLGASQKESPMYHPPMLPPSEESPMDYLHPPLLPHDEEALFSAYLHPPMSLPDWGDKKNGDHGNENRRDSDQNSNGQTDAGNNEMQMHQDSSHDMSHLVNYGDYVMSDAIRMYFKDN
ncbi:siderophore biosynthesis regulatory protein [Moniliophthora roreri]|uniref:Putative siderophore biosynthesis regulatory protein n=1 Tax=Moniliophthora roreri TaxID=221103 RepID=A0A0W0G3N7_MONRR|nr:siderophore biosynthesis regulatory protein [Moniliophthora roreri]